MAALLVYRSPQQTAGKPLRDGQFRSYLSGLSFFVWGAGNNLMALFERLELFEQPDITTFF
jgi:hypothetical protein